MKKMKKNSYEITDSFYYNVHRTLLLNYVYIYRYARPQCPNPMSAELLHAVEWDTPDVQRFVGLGLGRDEVMLYHFNTGSSVGTREFGFDTADVARCFDYSPSFVNFVGYGINSGSVYVRELNASGAQTMLQLKPQATRRCNALSFSSATLLATAYERVKQQDSIYLWDIKAESQVVPLTTLPVQETVNALKFVPQSNTNLLFGETKRISEFDIRSNSITTTIPTSLCLNIEFSKVNPNIFASYGESHHVALWDRRMFPNNTVSDNPSIGTSNTVSEPLLVMPRVFKDQKPDSRCLRFSMEDENELAVLQGGARIRRWELSSMPTTKRPLTSHLSSGLKNNQAHDEPMPSSNLSRRLTDNTDLEHPSVVSAAAAAAAAAQGQAAAAAAGVAPSSHSSWSGTNSVPQSVTNSVTTSVSNSVANSVSNTVSNLMPQAASNSTTQSSAQGSLNTGAPQITNSRTEGLGTYVSPSTPITISATERSLFVNKVYNLKTETDKVVSFDYTWNLTTGLPEVVCVRQSGTIYRMPILSPPAAIHFDPFNNFHTLFPPSDFLVASTQGVHLGEFTHEHHDNLQPKREGRTESPQTNDDKNINGERVHEGSSQDPASTSIPSGSGVAGVVGAVSGNSNSASSGGITSNTAPTKSGIFDESDSEEEKNTDSVSDEDDEESSADGLKLEVILRNDITTTMRLRALAGYSLDAQRNISLFTDPSSLNLPASCQEAINSMHNSGMSSSSIVAAWKWVKLQQDLMNQPNNYLQTPEIDLRYVGVASIWDELSEESLRFRVNKAPGSSGFNKPLTSKSVDDAVKYAVRKSPGSAYVSAGDDSNAYRQLGLRLAGWDFGLSELESRLVKLEEEGKFEKAAGWAVFHNNVERAVESLAKSGNKSLRLMSTAIAGYLVYKDVPTNNVWREQCRRLASELSAPYLRAIFAYISDKSWLDVLDDGSLPLTERLGIALRFLPQKEVGKYLNTLTTRAILKGDLEGIILTGFTPKVLYLLQAYLDRSGDIQTVCLLISFAWPRFVDNPQFPMWFSEYRQLLNSWQYFTQRARLDVARNKLDSQHPGFTPPIVGQAYLRCSHCKNIINWTKQTLSRDNSSKYGSKSRHSGVGGHYHRSGTSSDKTHWKLWNRCLVCNHQLPSCGVCTNSLGPCIDDEVESDRWPTFCLKCNHAFHSVHARQWFQKYNMCPIPSCRCYCSRSVSTAY